MRLDYSILFRRERVANNKIMIFDLPFSNSLGCLDVLVGIGAVLMISGNEVALKYCFPGCSFVLCSLEYCSMLLIRYFFSWELVAGFQTSKTSKNWATCFPVFNMLKGGILKSD